MLKTHILYIQKLRLVSYKSISEMEKKEKKKNKIETEKQR